MVFTEYVPSEWYIMVHNEQTHRFICPREVHNRSHWDNQPSKDQARHQAQCQKATLSRLQVSARPKMGSLCTFCYGCKQPVCLRETEYQVLNAESLLNLLALPCLTPWAKGRENGGWPDCSRGNHKKIWLLHISKCPEDKAGSFKVLDLHYFITYSQVYLGSIVIIAL